MGAHMWCDFVILRGWERGGGVNRSTTMSRPVLIAAAIVSGLYGVLVLTACGAQRALLFPAPKSVEQPSPASKVIELPETVLLVREPPTATAPVVLHFHGNGEQLAWLEWMAEAWQRQGAGFVAMEYPGYGLARDKGMPSEESIAAAAEVTAKYLETALGISRERLIVSGQSLGSGPAVRLAAQGIGHKLILFTPYTSLPDVAARWLPFLPVRLLMKDRFDSGALAAKVTQPVLIVHGTADEVVPFELGDALSKRLPNAQLMTIEGGHHNDVAGRDDVWRALTAFVAR